MNRKTKITAAAILVFLFILPLLWIDRACGTAPTCQISSRADDIWSSYSDAAAILGSDFIFPILFYLNKACFEIPTCQNSSRSDDIWPSYSDLSFSIYTSAFVSDRVDKHYCTSMSIFIENGRYLGKL